MVKPNVVYILADDMGYGDMECNNPGSRIPTPNLDRLAAQGMRFTDAHAPSSVCTPSRYAVLTGRYCWRTRLKEGVLWPWDPALIESDRLTVAELLRQNGYRTACIGKWHLGWNWQTRDGEPANSGTGYGVFDRDLRHELGRNIDYEKPMGGGPIDCGFDHYFGDDVPNFPPYTWFEQDRVVTEPTEEKPEGMFGHVGAMAPGWALDAVMPEITGRSVSYIEESGEEKPFFLYFPLTAPHTPIVPTDEFRGMSGCGEYGDYMCEVDWCVGQVMAALERKGIADNTLLLFASDNGPESPAYGHIQEYGHYSMAHLRGIKRDTWEGGHRVPFVARWPGVIAEGSACDQLTSHLDLIATCADFLGVELPPEAGEDSVSQMPLFRGERSPRSFAVHHSCAGKFAIRRGEWVFIDAPSGDDNREPQWFKDERGYTDHQFPGELYNLGDDIAERSNLYGDYPEVARKLRQLLARVKEDAGSNPLSAEGESALSE